MAAVVSRLKGSFDSRASISQAAERNDVVAEEIFAKEGAPQVGQLNPEEVAAGGLGRHLGVFSTTFLMYVSEGWLLSRSADSLPA